jgi:hypothetical protein
MLVANSHEFAAIATLKLDWLHKRSLRGWAVSALRLVRDVSISSTIPHSLQCRFGFAHPDRVPLQMARGLIDFPVRWRTIQWTTQKVDYENVEADINLTNRAPR